MRFANIDGRAKIIQGSRALDIGSVGRDAWADAGSFSDLSLHAQFRSLLETASDAEFTDFSAEDLQAPVPRPGCVAAVALNYQSHADETSRPASHEPVVFAKFPSSICGPHDAVDLDDDRLMVDYEAEIVAVIGATARRVQAADAWHYVAGLTVGQDISDREEQSRAPLKQFSFAKSYDTFAPIGPYLVTIDEFEDPDDLEVITRLDGKEMQHARSGEMICSIGELIAWISRRATLEVGDLIFTGTPSGVGNRRSPQVFLRPGMVLETEVEGIGVMRNSVHASSDSSSLKAH